MTKFRGLLLASLLLAAVAGIDRSGREDDPLYKERFADGYFPFEDVEVPNATTLSKLERREYCNQLFAEYLVERENLIKLTPPDYPMKVAILFVITNIHDINERDQAVTLTSFVEMTWRDRRLADIGGKKCSNVTKVVQSFHERIFFPMFTIENSADRVLYEEAWEKFPAVVYSSGVIVWISSLRLVLNCKMNMRIFPYDSQNCVILVRSPHYFQAELQYYVYSRQAALLLWDKNVSNPLWQLTGQLPRLMNSNISGIEIWFRLERKPSFYIWTLLVPTAIISLATCLSFTLPYDSTEKMQTMLTGILAYFLLLLTMTEVTPQASDNIPVLTIFFVIVIGVGMLGAIGCGVVVRIQNHSLRKAATSSKKPKGCSVACVLNDLFLVLYCTVMILCYVMLFVYISYASDEELQKGSSEFDYTDVLTFQ